MGYFEDISCRTLADDFGSFPLLDAGEKNFFFFFLTELA